MTGNPNKYIRKMFFDAIHNLTVDGKTIPCYDERVTGNTVKPHYVLLSTQTKREQKYTKCGDKWECSILLDIITTFPATGNTGSKLLAENIEEAIIDLEGTLTLAGGYVINERELVSSDSLTIIGTTTNVFRQLLRFNYFITL